MKYIIGLIPSTPLPYIETAQKLFSDVSDSYLLSETAHPHITTTIFKSEDASIVEALWRDIQPSNKKLLMPQLIGISIIKGLNIHRNFYWAQIAVERDPAIMQLHLQTLDLLKKYRLNSLVDSGDIYKPHITLARIKLQKQIPLWPESILAPSAFKLSLGIADQNGMYIKKLYE